jgi:hypothetical protein
VERIIKVMRSYDEWEKKESLIIAYAKDGEVVYG